MNRAFVPIELAAKVGTEMHRDAKDAEVRPMARSIVKISPCAGSHTREAKSRDSPTVLGLSA